VFACLWMGIQAGLYVKGAGSDGNQTNIFEQALNVNSDENLVQPTPGLTAQLQEPQTEMKLLVVGFTEIPDEVGELQQPQLNSVWLMIYNPEMPRLFWIAVFPADNQVNGISNQLLESQFRIDPNKQLSAEFLTTLRNQIQVNWDGLLIIDDTTLTQLIDTLGGITIDNNPMNGRQVLQSLDIPKEDYQAETNAQSRVIGAICQRRDQLAADGVALTPLVDWFVKQIELTNPTYPKMDVQLNSLLIQHNALFCQFADFD